MSIDRSTTGTAGTRTLQDDLLQDLRATAPVPTVPPAATVPPVYPSTPVVELRLTPLRWSPLRAEPVVDRSGLRVSVGPLQIFVGRHAG